jgi:hypothetical protein
MDGILVPAADRRNGFRAVGVGDVRVRCGNQNATIAVREPSRLEVSTSRDLPADTDSSATVFLYDRTNHVLDFSDDDLQWSVSGNLVGRSRTDSDAMASAMFGVRGSGPKRGYFRATEPGRGEVRAQWHGLTGATAVQVTTRL